MYNCFDRVDRNPSDSSPPMPCNSVCSSQIKDSFGEQAGGYDKCNIQIEEAVVV